MPEPRLDPPDTNDEPATIEDLGDKATAALSVILAELESAGVFDIDGAQDKISDAIEEILAESTCDDCGLLRCECPDWDEVHRFREERDEVLGRWEP